MWGFFGLNDGLTTSIALLRSLASAQRPEGLFVCLLSERKPGRVCEHLGQRIPLQAPLLWPIICSDLWRALQTQRPQDIWPPSHSKGEQG